MASSAWIRSWTAGWRCAWVLPGLAALAACGADSPEREAKAPAPTGWNLLYIVIDTLRADHLGPYGYEPPTSPTLDQFAKRSLVFERAYSAAPWTKPSVASMFTSLYPPQHRVLSEGTDNQLALSLTTFPEVLQEHGYRTLAISENPHVQPQTGFDQGFDRFERVRGYKTFKGHADTGAEKAIRWLGEPSQDPFFLYLHFLDPHGPYTPLDEFAGDFLAGLPEESGRRLTKGKVGGMIDGEELVTQLSEGELTYLEALYDAEIREVDAALATLFAFLSDAGHWENTIVLLTSDHGEEFLDHGSIRHGYRLYEESVHVPLMLALPGRPAGRIERVAAQHVDLAPTLLTALGLPVPPVFRGRDLLAAADSPGQEPDVLLSTDWRDIGRWAVRRGDWKLIVHEDQDRRQLFNLGDDPHEQNDLLTQNPDLVEQLLEAYAHATKPIPGVTPDEASGEADASLELELRGLGYLGGEEED